VSTNCIDVQLLHVLHIKVSYIYTYLNFIPLFVLVEPSWYIFAVSTTSVISAT